MILSSQKVTKLLLWTHDKVVNSLTTKGYMSDLKEEGDKTPTFAIENQLFIRALPATKELCYEVYPVNEDVLLRAAKLLYDNPDVVRVWRRGEVLGVAINFIVPEIIRREYNVNFKSRVRKKYKYTEDIEVIYER